MPRLISALALAATLLLITAALRQGPLPAAAAHLPASTTSASAVGTAAAGIAEDAAAAESDRPSDDLPRFDTRDIALADGAAGLHVALGRQALNVVVLTGDASAQAAQLHALSVRHVRTVVDQLILIGAHRDGRSERRFVDATASRVVASIAYVPPSVRDAARAWHVLLDTPEQPGPRPENLPTWRRWLAAQAVAWPIGGFTALSPSTPSAPSGTHEGWLLAIQEDALGWARPLEPGRAAPALVDASWLVYRQQTEHAPASLAVELPGILGTALITSGSRVRAIATPPAAHTWLSEQAPDRETGEPDGGTADSPFPTWTAHHEAPFPTWTARDDVTHPLTDGRRSGASSLEGGAGALSVRGMHVGIAGMILSDEQRDRLGGALVSWRDSLTATPAAVREPLAIRRRIHPASRVVRAIAVDLTAGVWHIAHGSGAVGRDGLVVGAQHAAVTTVSLRSLDRIAARAAELAAAFDSTREGSGSDPTPPTRAALPPSDGRDAWDVAWRRVDGFISTPFAPRDIDAAAPPPSTRDGGSGEGAREEEEHAPTAREGRRAWLQRFRELPEHVLATRHGIHRNPGAAAAGGEAVRAETTPDRARPPLMGPEPGTLAMRVRMASAVPLGPPANRALEALWTAQVPDPIAEGPALSRVRPTVVLLHRLENRDYVERVMSIALATSGYDVVLMYLPYFGPRGGGERFAAYRQLIGRFDDEAIDAFGQIAWDAHRLRDHLRAQPWVAEEGLHLMGISLGGLSAAFSAGLDPGWDRVVLLLAGGDLAQIIFTGAWQVRPLRELADARGASVADLRELVRPFDALTFADRIEGRRVLMINCREDEVIPVASANELLAAMPGTTIHWYPGDHLALAQYGIIVYPRLIAFLNTPLAGADDPGTERDDEPRAGDSGGSTE